MKKIVTLIMVLFTVTLTGGLYHTFSHLNDVGQEVIGRAHVEQLPPEMTDMVFAQIPGVPRY
jgi:hypothetical protein